MKIDVIIDNRVRVRVKDIGSHAQERITDLFEHENPKHAQMRSMGFGTKGEPAIIRTWKKEGRWLTVPLGGMSRVRSVLKEEGIHYRVIDKRTDGAPFADSIPDHNVELYGYQKTAKNDLIAKQVAILRAPTGSGKSTMGIAIPATLKVPTLIGVWSKGLLKQWVERCTKELGMRESDVGIIRGGMNRIRPITIAMLQTLAARGVSPDLAETFGCVIVDEVQRAAAPTMFRAIDPFKARLRFGISADERRKDKKEFLTMDLFGGIGANISRDRLIKSGHVLDVEIRIIPTTYEADWYKDAFRIDPELATWKQKTERQTVFDRLLEAMSVNKKRNALIVALVKEELARNEQVMVLSHRREHCLILDQALVGLGVRSGFLIGGEDYESEYDRTKAGIVDGSVRVAVGTVQAVGQALDLPRLAVGVMTTPIASNEQMVNQVRGRVCRTAKGKESARLYYLWDQHVHGMTHVQNLIKWNNRVVVRARGRWIEGRQYVKDRKKGRG